MLPFINIFGKDIAMYGVLIFLGLIIGIIFAVYYFSRFYDKTIVAEKRARLNFNKKAANDLIDEAAKTLTHAKAVHDDIEKYYVGAMNFDKAKEVEKAIIDEISKI